MGNLGEKIKDLRTEKGLTLKELSNLTAFSISFLSLVERGQSSLSITSLAKIAEALGVTTSYFFPPPPAAAHVVRKGSRREFRLESSPIVYSLLSGNLPNRAIEPILVTLPPNATQAEAKPYAHKGEEFAYILEGTLVLIIDGQEYLLEAGDSIHFDSGAPHLWENRTGFPVKALWVNTPKIF